MNTTSSNPSLHPEARHEAGPTELLRDVSRIGPAPNRSRVAVVMVVITAAALSYVGIRWVVGTRKWSRR